MTPSQVRSVWRGLGLCVIVTAGLVAIVGSGGGADAPPQCSFFSDTCNPTVDPTPLASSAVEPARISVQVGTAVGFTVHTANVDRPSYQWKRADGSGSYVPIAGATGPSYTLPGANLADDGARFVVDVRNGAGTLVVGPGLGAQGWSQLLVSSLPGTVLQDTDFAAADWAVNAVASPGTGAPTHSAARAPDGGNPGAYRLMTHAMPAGPSSLRVEHLWAGPGYDPAVQGALRAIDYSEDCALLANTTSTYRVSTQPLIEQGGRRYTTAGTGVDCPVATWTRRPWASLQAQDFSLSSGPACGATEACPDFSANGAPLHFGYVRTSAAVAGVGGTLSHGIDNWTVTLWRR